MDLGEANTDAVNTAGPSVKELIQRYCENRADEEVATELWQRCREQIHKTLKWWVYSICPDFCDRETFLDSAFHQASINFLNRICGFKGLDSLRSLKKWLAKLAQNTAFDEYRRLTRSRTDIEEISLHEIFPEEPDKDPRKRSAKESEAPLFQTKYLSHYGRAQKIPPPDAGIKAEERKFIVRELLARYAAISDENCHSAQLVRNHYLKEWEVARIAVHVYGTPADDREEETQERRIYRDMSHDCEKLHSLLTTEFGIKELREV